MDNAAGGAVGLIVAILIWCVVGLVIGLVARFLLPGPDPAGVGLTMLFGIIGSLIGGSIARAIGLSLLLSWIVIIAASMLVVWLYRFIRRSKTA